MACYLHFCSLVLQNEMTFCTQRDRWLPCCGGAEALGQSLRIQSVGPEPIWGMGRGSGEETPDRIKAVPCYLAWWRKLERLVITNFNHSDLHPMKQYWGDKIIRKDIFLHTKLKSNIQSYLNWTELLHDVTRQKELSLEEGPFLGIHRWMVQVQPWGSIIFFK